MRKRWWILAALFTLTSAVAVWGVWCFLDKSARPGRHEETSQASGKESIWEQKREPPLTEVIAALQEKYADWRNAETRVYVLDEPLRSSLTGDQLLEVLGSRFEPDFGRRPKPLPGSACIDGLLVVRQTPAVHAEVARALAKLRHLLAPEKFPRPEESLEETAARQVETVLEQSTSFDVGETTLAKAAELISRKHWLNVRLDTPALDSIGIGADTPVSFVPQQMPLKTALRLLLRDLDLTYILRDETLYITSLDAGGWPAAQFYLVPRQLEARLGRRWIDCLADSLELPPPHDDTKSRGIYVYGDLFVTIQFEDVHDQIARLLDALELAVEQDAETTEPVDAWPPSTDFTRRTLAKLKEPTSIDAEGAEFDQVVQRLAERHDVPIVIDLPALDALAIDSDFPVELELGNVPLQQALSLLAVQRDLTVVVDRGVIEITTPEEADKRLPLRIYPARDLLTRPHLTAETLIDALMAATGREHWWQSGGPCSISELDGVLVVSATHKVHDDLEQALASLRDRSRTTGQQ